MRVEEILDRNSLDELCSSIHALFGISVRVYSAEGTLLASVASDLDVCLLVNKVHEGGLACGRTVGAAKTLDPGEDGDLVHPCFTGLAYRIVPLNYEGRRVGRVVIGPYAPSGLREPPPPILRMLPTLDMRQFDERLSKVPRVKPEALARIARHLKATLELIIFSSHKAYITSQLHLHSVREGYRALEDKTERLEQALARLREVDRLKSTFLGTVSHELRTPLTSIIGYSEMLAAGIAGPLMVEQAEFVETIRSRGEQLLSLIISLLDLSKLDSGTMSLKHAPLSIGPVLAEVYATVSPAAARKLVKLTIENDDVPCELMGDGERLRQVFVNLVDNAVKFTAPGGRVLLAARVISMPIESDDDSDGEAILGPVRRAVEVTVSDTGIGIPLGERSKVFDPFYQVDSSSTREHGGTGLGLSIVKRIVDAHGGSVVVTDNQPKGTRFIVKLPSASAQRVLLSRVPPAVL